MGRPSIEIVHPHGGPTHIDAEAARIVGIAPQSQPSLKDYWEALSVAGVLEANAAPAPQLRPLGRAEGPPRHREETVNPQHYDVPQSPEDWEVSVIALLPAVMP